MNRSRELLCVSRLTVGMSSLSFRKMAREARSDFSMLLASLFLLSSAGAWSVDACLNHRRETNGPGKS